MQYLSYVFVILFTIVFGLLGWFASDGVKTQLVRAADILLFGPFLIYISTQVDAVWASIFLIFIGATTITYNLKNFIVDSK